MTCITLTDGNVGAKKHRSVRDSTFVISTITNSVINGNSTASIKKNAVTLTHL